MTSSKASVAILMATRNGLQWLPEQIESILSQTGVAVRIFISDDSSNDGTVDWIKKLASIDNRVVLFDSDNSFGSAGKNFYHLIKNLS